MSQYTYHHKQFAILAGWDRPLQYHFLTVERRGHDDDPTDATIVYSNLDDPDLPRGAMSAGQVIAKLQELQIPIPANFEQELELDQLHNIGNRTFSYGVL